MKPIPVIFLAFANDHDDYLTQINQERRSIARALERHQDRGSLNIWAEPGVSSEDLFSVARKYDQRIAIFHYGGHADGTQLRLEAMDGTTQAAYPKGLASLLGAQAELQLVFLNGCATRPQVETLFQEGVKAVIATSVALNDRKATAFAEQFYRALADGATIQKAFEDAGKYLQTTFADALTPKVFRGIVLKKSQDPTQLPWGLYLREGCDDVANWKLPQPPAIALTKIPGIDLQTGFLGRDKDLERLEKHLQSSAQVVLVNGLGGIGKTTLARAYVHQHYNDYRHIAWIGGAEDLLTAFALNQDLAANLDMPFQEKEDIQERLQRILQRLRGLSAPGNGRNLLVIDNAIATIADKAVHDQLPGPPGWHVLVTSREELPGFQLLKLDTLEPKAARELFRTHYKGRVGERELEALLTTIGYHTLTIELLAKMLHRMSGLLTVAQLTEKLSRHELDDPDIQEAVWTQHSGEQRTVYKHLIQAFKLSHLTQEEKHLLANLAVLPAVTYTATLLAELLNTEPLPLNRLLQSLADKGWINRYEEGGFSVHRMIQEVVILQERPGYEDLKELVEVLTLKMEQDDYGNPVTDNFPWVPYVEPVAVHFSRSGSTEQAVAVLWNNLAGVYQTLGLYEEAAELLEKTLASALANFDQAHPTVATMQSNLALVYQDLGRYEEAAGLLEKALASALANFDQAHPTVAISQSNLATVYFSLGKRKEARSLLEQALSIVEKQLGVGHPYYRVISGLLKQLDKIEGR